MARVKFSPLFASITGSIGSITLQRNAYGHSVRNKPFNLSSSSASQSLIRSHNMAIKNSWRGLSDSEKSEWIKFASFYFQSIRTSKRTALSGYALFIKYNLIRLISGLGIFTAPVFTVPVQGNIEPQLFVEDSEFFFIGGYGTRTMSHTHDLINFDSTLGFQIDTVVNDITYNGSRFVAVGQGTKTIGYTTLGTSFSYPLVSPFSISGFTVMWDGAKFIAGGKGGNSIAWSVNGSSWTGLGTGIFSGACLAIVKSPLRYVAGGSSVNTLAYSSDGLNWTGLGNTIFTSSCRALAWNGKIFVAGGTGTNTLAYSSDGLNWTGIGCSLITDECNSIIWDGVKFLACGEEPAEFFQSSDGINWYVVSHGLDVNEIMDLTYNGVYYYLAAKGTDIAAYSTDGFTWLKPTPSAYLSFASATCGKGLPYSCPGVFFSVDFDPGHSLTTFDQWLLLRLSPPVNPGAVFDRKLLRTVVVPYPSSTPFDLSSQLYALFNYVPRAGDRIFCEMTLFSTDAPVVFPVHRSLLTVETS